MEDESVEKEPIKEEPPERKPERGKGEKKPRGGRSWRLPVIIIIIVLGIGGIVAGVGFINVDKVEPYDCGYYEDYDCGYYEDVDCGYYEGVDCGYYEDYDCGYYMDYPCEQVEEQDVSYTEWDDGWSVESWLQGCDVDVWTNIRNTDSYGGQFYVQFKCYYEGLWHSIYRNEYIAPGDTEYFAVEFGKPCGVSCSSCQTIVTPPTKPVTVTDICTTWVDETCTRWVEQTCAEWVEETCSRWVDKTCERWIDKTCYRTVQENLLWK